MTGASSGIGRATTDLLVADGDEVISLDIQEAPPGAARHIHCDMSDPVSIDAAVAQLDGRVDGLLNVAGVPGTLSGEMVMRVNTLGLRHLSEALLDRVERGGAIVNVASIAGFSWQRHLEDIQALLKTADFESGLAWCAKRDMDGNAAYMFSKECVVVYTMQLAGPALARGLRCNSVSPGPVETPILPDFKEQAGPGQLEWVMKQTGRGASPLDIARTIRMLAGPETEWVNGRDLIVDGGFSAGIAMNWIDRKSAPAAQRRVG